jgi:hypothetical protein
VHHNHHKSGAAGVITHRLGPYTPAELGAPESGGQGAGNIIARVPHGSSDLKGQGAHGVVCCGGATMAIKHPKEVHSPLTITKDIEAMVHEVRVLHAVLAPTPTRRRAAAPDKALTCPGGRAMHRGALIVGRSDDLRLAVFQGLSRFRHPCHPVALAAASLRHCTAPRLFAPRRAAVIGGTQGRGRGARRDALGMVGQQQSLPPSKRVNVYPQRPRRLLHLAPHTLRTRATSSSRGPGPLDGLSHS